MRTTIETVKKVSFIDANKNRVNLEMEITQRNGYPEFTISGNMGASGGQIVDDIEPANEPQKELIALWHEWHLNGMHAGTEAQENAIRSPDFEEFKLKIRDIINQAEKIEAIVNGPFEKYCQFVGIPKEWSSARHDHNNLKKVWGGTKVTIANGQYLTTSDFFKFVNSIPKGMRPKFEWNSHVPPQKVKEIFGGDYSIKCAFLESKQLLIVPHPITGEPYKYGSEWLRRDLPGDFETTLDSLIESIKELETERKGENLSELSDSDLLALIEEKTTYEGDQAQFFAAIVRQFDLSLNDFNDVEINDNRITVQGIDYVAGTDDEMDTIAEEEISESVWAFNASFLAQQTEFDQEIFEALQPKCEGANDAILKIINKTCGIEEFAEAAIQSDGRGHFLNHYDGTEDEKQFNGTTYYFCRS